MRQGAEVRYHVAIDLGGTRVRVALTQAPLSIDGRVERPSLIARREQRTVFDLGPESAIRQMAEMTQAAMTEAGVEESQLACVGVAAPGPLDPATGFIISAPNMPGWGEVRLKEELEQRIGAPTSIRNDADAAALGEYYFGAGRGAKILVYFTVSTGVGGGIVIGGELLAGRAPGELGHITVDRHGRPCHCGAVGCVEALASGTSIAEQFREALTRGEPSSLSSDATAGDIARAAANKDDLARRIWNDAMEALAFGVLSAINVFDPDIVVLGGGVTASGDLLFKPVRETVERHEKLLPGRKVPIVPAELGEDVGLLGAAIVAEQCLDRL